MNGIENKVFLTQINWASRSAMERWLTDRGATIDEARLADTVEADFYSREVWVKGARGVRVIPLDRP